MADFLSDKGDILLVATCIEHAAQDVAGIIAAFVVLFGIDHFLRM